IGRLRSAEGQSIGRGSGRCSVPCVDSPTGPGRDSGGGHVQTGRDLRPSNLRKTSQHHDEVAPSEPLGTVEESNNLHATCNAFSPHTNNRLSTRTRGRAVAAEREPHVVAVGGQF